ncbi:MAG: flagellar hook-associated protein FlgK [Nitrincola lacisaponensis]|uniref:Flagellar hook-associated protein 1 n=1 Tax=Nitrincola lacisaponensis TaxID=267850 RepID=A0A063Y440_9GAMM|nr:flagellar hook-associated protein FlgK [Nitrincola lacisaponensis]KDE40444.1 Flagellar hook-associated protein FlgK [Nitrincola lacisaponensis]
MSSLLSLGVQGVRASQGGLNVTGNNVANVNTPGYTRQVPQFQSLEGGGVKQEYSQRIVNQFINARIWADSSRFEAARAFEQLSNQLDNTLASESSSLAIKLDDFFGALQAANDDPTSITSRELMVAESEATVRRFRDLYGRIDEQNQTVNTRIRELTEEINTQAKNIAALNDRIRIAQAGGKESFELLDQRDQAIKELSELIDIQVIEQSNGESTIFIGNGQPLVVGQTSNQLIATPGKLDPSQLQVNLLIAGRQNNITNYIGGGELGGILEYRKDVLNSALDELGRLALVFADTMNSQHALGMDLDGNMGQKLFRDINDLVLMNSRFQADFAQGNVRITDTSLLQASEYELVFTSESDFRLTRLSDGKTWTQNSFEAQASAGDVDGEQQLWFDPGSGDLVLQIDGMRITADKNTPFSINERFLMQPTRTAADDMRTDISSGRQLALASPVSISADSANTGTGSATLSVTEVVASEMSPLEALKNLLPEAGAQIELTRNGSGYDIALFDANGDPVIPSELTATIDPSNPKQLIVRNTDAGLPGEIRVDINGVPQDGDQFRIGYNFEVDSVTGAITNIGVSDNRNGLLMADLTKQKTSLEGTYQDTYGRLVERVGITTKIAQMDTKASQAVLQNSINQREEISGVNQDEEMVRLIQFQQAYQAATQLITASQRTFDALINAV